MKSKDVVWFNSLCRSNTWTEMGKGLLPMAMNNRILVETDGKPSNKRSEQQNRIAMNAALAAQVHRLETALDNMSQGLCMFDAQSTLVVCNARYLEIFNLHPGTLQFGMSQENICEILIANGCYPPSVTLDEIRNSTRVALHNESPVPIFRELSDGRVLNVLYRSLQGGGWVSTFEDITQQRRSEARIKHLARHDGLTDLANSRTLREESHSLINNLPIESPLLAVHYLDLDRFKFVNDTYGHAVGDELLCAVAGRLRAVARRDDLVGRLGGDEFAVLQRVSQLDAATTFAQRIVKTISAPYLLSTGRVEIGVSIGVATRHGIVSDVQPLIQEADLALRQAKATERGTVCLFDPSMFETARQRRVLEGELHAALAREEFELHYQPQVDLDSNRITGVEALVRWQHSERGLVPPATFIPLAEEIGLIVPIGEWVMRRACRDAVTWPDHIVIAVNASSLQMRQKSFSNMVLAVLAETGLPARRLEIEITESALLDESEITMHNLHTLRAHGVRFAMDDFGTGYSSLSYLRRFPIDKIKIDRSFMKDAETNADALAIIRAVAGLGMSLGMTTVVEGVENEVQLGLARAEGVCQVQGFLFSRPQPKSAISSMLNASLQFSKLTGSPINPS